MKKVGRLMWLQWNDGGGVGLKMRSEMKGKWGVGEGVCVGVISLLPCGPVEVSIEEAHNLTDFLRISGLQKS